MAEQEDTAGQKKSTFSALNPFPGATKFVGIITVYYTALAGLLAAYVPLGKLLEEHLGISDPRAQFAFLATPLLLSLVFHALPTFLKEILRARRARGVVRGHLKPGYAMLAPRGPNDHFERADKAHDTVYEWILERKAPILYFTGRSGSGKSSLLYASVLPRLKESASTYKCIVLRSFSDPIPELRKILDSMLPTAIQAPRSLRGKLRAVCDFLGDGRLLIVFDQFEELLVVHGEESETTRKVVEAMQDIESAPIAELTILLVFRREYMGMMLKAGLGPVSSDSNWSEVNPFTKITAAEFLMNSGLELSTEQIDGILKEADRDEDDKGYIRPVTLNMICLALNRASSRGYRSGKILYNYVRYSLDDAGRSEVAYKIVKNMLTDAESKVPRTVKDLEETTGLGTSEVKQVLSHLQRDGLVRLLNPAKELWEVSHDFVAPLIGRAIGRDNRTAFQKAAPILLGTSLAAWCFVLGILWLQRLPSETMADVLTEVKGGTYDLSNRTINAAETNLRVSEISRLTHCSDSPSLLGLDLAYTNTSPQGSAARFESLEGFGRFESLEFLDLTDCVTLSSLNGIESLKNLHTLYLTGCVALESIEALASLTSLRHLYLADCTQLTSIESLKKLEKLESLDLSRCNRIMDLAPLAKLPALQKLTIRGCTALKDISPLADVPKLEWLDVAYCNGVANWEILESLSGVYFVNAVGVGEVNLPSSVTQIGSPTPGRDFIETRNGVNLCMIWVKEGMFSMGSPKSEPDRGEYEDLHTVQLSGFWVSSEEITTAQFAAIMGKGTTGGLVPEMPIVSISWLEVAQCKADGPENSFCEQLGPGYDVPTEAQWEYACRAGSTGRYCFGEDEARLGHYAWYYGNLGARGEQSVGEKRSNGWGLYDMHGNVWEWCRDWHGPYEPADRADPLGPEKGSYRVLRGGLFDPGAGHCRSANRSMNVPDTGDYTMGFRVVRTP